MLVEFVVNKHSLAIAVVKVTLQLVFDDSEWVAIAVVTTSQLVEVKRVGLASVAIVAFHIFRTNALAYENYI